MEIFYCPVCEGKPYTNSIKGGTRCPVCKSELKYADVSPQSLEGRPKLESTGKVKAFIIFCHISLPEYFPQGESYSYPYFCF